MLASKVGFCRSNYALSCYLLAKPSMPHCSARRSSRPLLQPNYIHAFQLHPPAPSHQSHKTALPPMVYLLSSQVLRKPLIHIHKKRIQYQQKRGRRQRLMLPFAPTKCRK